MLNEEQVCKNEVKVRKKYWIKEIDLNIHAKVFDLWLGFGKTCRSPKLQT